MHIFEQQVIGEIPLHEAASFFVGMKTFPAREQVKTAAVKSETQQMIGDLLKGDMPEGKAGRFKTLSQIKESAAAPRAISKAVQRGAELLSGEKAKLLREASSKALGRAGAQVAPIRPGSTPNVKALRETGYAKSGLRMKGDSTSRSLRPLPGGPALKASKKLDDMAASEAKKVDRTRLALVGSAGAAAGTGAGIASSKKKESSAAATNAFKRSAEILSSAREGSLRSAAKSLSQTRLKAAPKDSSQAVNAVRDRFKTAAAKLGFSAGSPMAGAGEPEANMEGGQPTPAASNLPAMPQAGASMAPPQGPVQDPEAAKPSTEQTVPVNYMGAELLAQAAQRTNETGFLRERLNAATEQNNALNQQLQSLQSQLDEVATTQQAAGDQIMQATNEAVASSTRALEHSMQAANMRIGIQKMREAMMELASQDPESMGTLAQQQQVQDESMEQQAVNAATGAPGQSATPPTQPGVPAAGAQEEGGPEGGGSGESPAPKGTSVNIKTAGPSGATIVGGLAGAALGGLMGHRASQGVDEAQAQVESLKGQQSGSFAQSLELARAKERLAKNELAAAHPRHAVIGGALKGGIGGAAIGSALNQLGRSIKSQLPQG